MCRMNARVPSKQALAHHASRHAMATQTKRTVDLIVEVPVMVTTEGHQETLVEASQRNATSNNPESPLSRMVNGLKLEIATDEQQKKDLKGLRDGLDRLRQINYENEQKLIHLISMRSLCTFFITSDP